MPEDLTLARDFPAVEHDQWTESVLAVLGRGRHLSSDELRERFDATLTTAIEDGITLDPLYTESSSVPAAGEPGGWPFTRGATAASTLGGWEVRQRVPWLISSDRTAAAVAAEMSQGATGLWLDLLGVDLAVVDLATILTGIDLTSVPLTLSSQYSAPLLAGMLQEVWDHRGLDPAHVTGCLGLDPYGHAARRGGAVDIDAELGTAARIARGLVEGGSSGRTLVADGTIYHDAGASAGQELALALATGVAYLRVLLEAGFSADQAAGQVEFRFSATDDQFLTIAKLRAARVLWARVCEVAGVSEAAAGQRQHAVTSAAMVTRYDPWVNLLRGTVACFAAGVGGASSVTVAPHDDAGSGASATDLGRRLARNTQLVLLAESHLAQVIDPAGGSWFVESLTNQLAESAWQYFREIEGVGGIYPSLRQGDVQTIITKTRDERTARISRRAMPVTGVSEFPLTQDSPLPRPDASGSSADESTSTEFAALERRRYSEPFEALRDRAAAIAATHGTRPRVFLATLGTVAEHTARSRFVTNLFAAGGIESVDGGTLDPDQIGAAFEASGAPLVCICGNDEANASIAPTIARGLGEHHPARLYLAGEPRAARGTLDAAGVQEYIVAGDDAVDMLTRALDAVEARP